MTITEHTFEQGSLQPPGPRACPVCGGTRSTVLYRQSFEQLSGVHLLSGYDVVICQDCGAGFADGIPEQEVFDRYYRDLSKYDDRERSSGPSVVEQRFHDIAALIAEYIPSVETRVFEIGCASGGLLRALQERGFHNLYGSDPSPACIRAARELHGIQGVPGTVFSAPQPETPYDFLVLTGVMEHIRDLDRTVKRFHEFLGHRGRVYLEVPDASRYDSRLDAPFQEFSLEHVNYFSRISLANLMGARGFRVLKTGHTVRPLHEATCPCTFGVFEVAEETSAMEHDGETELGLRQYIEGCRAEDARIRSVIRDSAPAGQRLIVWGVGAHTLRLLATGGLEPSRIALFVDSSSHCQNRELRGIRVASPAELSGHSEPILISSRNCQQEIRHQIRNTMGLRNPLVVLYDAPPEGV